MRLQLGGESHPIFINIAIIEMRQRCVSALSPSFTGIGVVEITQIFCFHTNLDLGESSSWLSSNFSCRKGLAIFVPFRGISAGGSDWGRSLLKIELTGAFSEIGPPRTGQSLGRRCLVKSLSGGRQRTCLPTKHVNSSVTHLAPFWDLLKTYPRILLGLDCCLLHTPLDFPTPWL